MNEGQRIRHLKRGSTYLVVGLAHLQTDKPISDMESLVIYRAGDGTLWVRPMSEFTPDRFEIVE